MIRFDGERIDGDQEVRVAINPSILQIFMGNGYYILDNVPPVPYNNKNNTKQQGPYSSDDDDSFGNLFLQFCSRLSEQRRVNSNKIKNELCLLYITWLLVACCLIAPVVRSDPNDCHLLLYILLPCWMITPLLVPPLWFPALLAQIRLANNNPRIDSAYYQFIQEQLVDDMAPSFREQGFHVDYVEDNHQYCFSLIYIRFKRNNNSTQKSDTDNIPLAKILMELQEKAHREHTEAMIDQRQIQRQQEEQALKNNPEVICGIQKETLLSLQPMIILLMIPLGFVYLMLMMELFFPMFHDWGGIPPTHFVRTTELVGRPLPPPPPPVIVDNNLVSIYTDDSKESADADGGSNHNIELKNNIKFEASSIQ